MLIQSAGAPRAVNIYALSLLIVVEMHSLKDIEHKKKAQISKKTVRCNMYINLNISYHLWSYYIQ